MSDCSEMSKIDCGELRRRGYSIYYAISNNTCLEYSAEAFSAYYFSMMMYPWYKKDWSLESRVSGPVFCDTLSAVTRLKADYHCDLPECLYLLFSGICSCATFPINGVKSAQEWIKLSSDIGEEYASVVKRQSL